MRDQEKDYIAKKKETQILYQVIMTAHLTKLTYCELDPWEYTSVKFD